MAKKKPIRYICPCCYGSIDLNQVHYSCSNPECVKEFLSKCSSSEKRRHGSQYIPNEEIDVEKSEYLGIDPRCPEAVTTKEHIIRGSVNGTCDICRGKDTVKLCPNCHDRISHGAEVNGTTIFITMGTEGSGKSHYLASLIPYLEKNFTEEFGTAFEASGVKTTKKFDEIYRTPAYYDGKCLAPTPSYMVEASRPPLLYNVGKEGEEGSRTIAFIDTSGTDLSQSDKLAILNIKTYISTASGIMLFVDPMQIPGIRKKLGLPTSDGEFPDMADTLNYISEIIRDNNKMRPKDNIDIPLAVILTKSDLLIRSASGIEDEDALFGPESSLHIEREKGFPDFVNINQIGAELEEYLRRNVGPEFIDEVNKYNSHQYFAVSSIGSDPIEGKLIKGVTPYRVEDPMIWFLNNTVRRKWF